eukprot:6761089-Lingulodinium_polyedra.AAC.1
MGGMPPRSPSRILDGPIWFLAVPVWFLEGPAWLLEGPAWFLKSRAGFRRPSIYRGPTLPFEVPAWPPEFQND